MPIIYSLTCNLQCLFTFLLDLRRGPLITDWYYSIQLFFSFTHCIIKHAYFDVQVKTNRPIRRKLILVNLRQADEPFSASLSYYFDQNGDETQ